MSGLSFLIRLASSNGWQLAILNAKSPAVILANLSYIFETYGIEVLIVNELTRKSHNDQIEEVQSGGNVMDFWVSYSIKIERTERLSVRNLTIRKHRENKKVELSSILTNNGFE